MNLRDLSDNGKKKEIPKDLYSKLTDAPIEKCTFCDKELLESNEDYLIEKVVKRYKQLNSEDVIIEYAICFECLNEVSSSISEESQKFIEEFFLKNMDMTKSNIMKMLSDNFDFKEWTNSCVFTGNKKEDLDEYNLIVQCQGRNIVFMICPYMIDSRVFEDLYPKLSKQTKEDYGGFMNKVTDPPPEFEELLKDRPLILL